MLFPNRQQTAVNANEYVLSNQQEMLVAGTGYPCFSYKWLEP
jgi:hypothetical protein